MTITLTAIATDDDGQDWKSVLPVWAVLHLDRMAGPSPEKAWRAQFHGAARSGRVLIISFRNGDDLWGLSLIKQGGE